jgi:hypothetical protein
LSALILSFPADFEVTARSLARVRALLKSQDLTEAGLLVRHLERVRGEPYSSITGKTAQGRKQNTCWAVLSQKMLNFQGEDRSCDGPRQLSRLDEYEHDYQFVCGTGRVVGENSPKPVENGMPDSA